MAVVLIVGTDKGGMLLRTDDARERWEIGELGFRGWMQSTWRKFLQTLQAHPQSKFNCWV